MGKSLTPKSGQRLPDGPDSPVGIKRSVFPDKETPNTTEAWDVSKEVMPVVEQDYLKDAAGKN